MSRRSTPQAKVDDHTFPVRLFVQVPETGFGRLVAAGPDSIHAWLDREVGRGNYAIHGGGRGFGLRDRAAFYFRAPAAAANFMAAFPQIELADSTADDTGSSPTPQSERC